MSCQEGLQSDVGSLQRDLFKWKPEHSSRRAVRAARERRRAADGVSSCGTVRTLHDSWHRGSAPHPCTAPDLSYVRVQRVVC